MDNPIFIFPYSKQLSVEMEVALVAGATDFLSGWKAHDEALKSKAWVEENQFLLIEVDESQAYPSGCSKDKLYHLVKNLNENLGIVEAPLHLFFLKIDGEIIGMEKKKLKELWENESQSKDYQLFPNWISTRSGLEENWGKPLNHFRQVLNLTERNAIFQK